MTKKKSPKRVATYPQPKSFDPTPEEKIAAWGRFLEQVGSTLPPTCNLVLTVKENIEIWKTKKAAQ